MLFLLPGAKRRNYNKFVVYLTLFSSLGVLAAQDNERLRHKGLKVLATTAANEQKPTGVRNLAQNSIKIKITKYVSLNVLTFLFFSSFRFCAVTEWEMLEMPQKTGS